MTHLKTLGTHQLERDGQRVRLAAGQRRICEVLVLLLEHGPQTLKQIQRAVFSEELSQLSRDYFHQIRKALRKADLGIEIAFDPVSKLYSLEAQNLVWDVALVRRGELKPPLDAEFLPDSDLPWVEVIRKGLQG